MKKAVLLVNLGTPVSPTYKDLRVYLDQFLSDRRVVNKCPYIWKPLLKGILLQIIPQKSAKKYSKIWDKKINESPLFTYTKKQSEKLQKLLQDEYTVDFAFTYDAGRPEFSIEHKIKAFTGLGYKEITILPLYPQYSVATTASVYDQVGVSFKSLEYIPTIKIIDSYYNEDKYIKALAASVKTSITEKTTDIVCSFHGVPVKYIEKGDVYQNHCQQTFHLLKEELEKQGVSKNFHLTYQSQFGRDEWLGPKTDAMINLLADNKVENIAVITPGFSVDCIETLDEIGSEAKQEFMNRGGKQFIFIKSLNDTDAIMDLFVDLVKK